MDWKYVSDEDLIAECLRRQLAKGNLVADESIWVGGIRHNAGYYALAFLNGK